MDVLNESLMASCNPSQAAISRHQQDRQQNNQRRLWVPCRIR